MPDTEPSAAPRLARYAREMRALARRTRELPGPEPVREPRDRLARAMTVVSGDLARLSAAAARDDQPAAVNAIENARAHSRALSEARAALESAAR